MRSIAPRQLAPDAGVHPHRPVSDPVFSRRLFRRPAGKSGAAIVLPNLPASLSLFPQILSIKQLASFLAAFGQLALEVL